ncbi:MAG: M4 family metallopeptidase [Chitinophagaceae bacterium]|nr:M4 family metallopeptidase [Chitinophagaceae bacterium]
MTANFSQKTAQRIRSFRALFLLVSCVLTLQLHAQKREAFSEIKTWCEPFKSIEFLQFKESSKVSSDEFLLHAGEWLNLPTETEMKLLDTRTDEYGITHRKYQQYYKNVPVMGGEMILNEKNGRLLYINGMYMTVSQSKATPEINQEEAFKRSLSHINATDYTWLDHHQEDSTATNTHTHEKPTGELWWVSNMAATPEERTYTLGWKYRITVHTQLESHDVYLNATTGELLLKIPLQWSCSAGTCQTLWNGQKTISTKFQTNTYIMKNDCNSANIYIRNANNDFSTITDYTDVDNNWPSTTLGKYVGQTMWSMERTRDYYATVHNRLGYDSAGFDFNVYLNPGFVDNAYFDSGSDIIKFGGNAQGDSAVVALDIAGHEATHGFVHFTSNLAYSNQPGALNESFADIFGEMVERHALGTHDWMLGTDIYMGAFRNMANPNQFNHPDTYYGSNYYVGSWDYGGVHVNSGVQNYWFYLLVNGGSGVNDDLYAYNVTGIGYTKARNLAYQTMIGLTSNANFSSSKDLSIAIATNLYGQCSAEVMAVRKAWAAVGVGDTFSVYETLNTVTVSASSTNVCSGAAVTLTASGANLYTYAPSQGTGAVYTVYPTATTTYTVTGTNPIGSCGGTTTITITVAKNPVITATVSDNSLCAGESSVLNASISSVYDTLSTIYTGWYDTEAQQFDLTANQAVTLRALNMNLSYVTQVKVWYKFGGTNGANITSSAGWTPWGGIINVIPAGQGNKSFVQLPYALNLSAGQTVAILVATNGYINVETGSSQNPMIFQDGNISVKQGVYGTGFNGTFDLHFTLGVFNGDVIYNVQLASYSWTPSATLSSSSIFNPTCTPTATTTYTVTAATSSGCTSTASKTVYVNAKPQIQSVVTGASPLCAGASTTITANALSSEFDQLITSATSSNYSGGAAFNVTTTKAISINSFSIITDNSTQAEIWFKVGGYGGTDFTTSSGWTKLGNTISFSPLGLGTFTNVFPSVTMNIPAGATYGFVIVTNGMLRYKNGTAIGNVVSSNEDVSLFEGHAGSGFGGNFNFNLSPKIWCGKISYAVDNQITGYAWTGGASTLSSTTIANPTASPTSSTTYTVTVTDGNSCTNSATKKLFVRANPQLVVAASPAAICSGGTAQMMIGNGTVELDAIQTSASGTNTTATNGGVMFNVSTIRPITLNGVKLHIQTGATLAEVWYKTTSYGNANVTSSTGWTKLGNTVSISAAGNGAFTDIPLSTSLNIPANTTYGIAIVCNGIVRYTSGTSIGTTIETTPELSITQGHAGTGFNGVFNFTTSPVIMNGMLSYSVQPSYTSYQWAPTTGVSNPTSSAPSVQPSASTPYTVTVTDMNGCTGNASVGVTVMNPYVGTATLTASSPCLGNAATMQYTQPSGNQCHGVLQTGFAGSYAPATWTTVAGGLGNITTSSAPSSVSITSGNTGVNTTNSTAWQHSILCSGYVTFNWTYTTGDVNPTKDYPRYSINGGTAQVLPGFKNGLYDPNYQSGTFSMYLNAGDVLQIQAYTQNNMNGACTITLVGFSAPYSTTSAQTVQWYTQAVGGSLLGSGSSLNTTFNTLGNQTFYAAITNTANGCSILNRVPTNTINVSQPNVSASALNAVCSGSSIALTANGASIYNWQPGNLNGGAVYVNPTSTTVYTVTGTSSLGCTNTATKLITVYALPNVQVTASSNTVSCNSSSTLTASGADSYFWMPSFTAGSSLMVTPTTTTTYTVTGTSLQGCTATATQTITVVPCPSGNLLMLVYVEGYYDQGGFMKPVLNNQGVLAPTNVADSVTIEFRDVSSAHNLVHSANALLETNGVVHCSFPNALIGGSYYIVFKHRNALETWSGTPVLLSNSSYYDFSYDPNQAYGQNMKELYPGFWFLYSGDLNQDGSIDVFDYLLMEPDITSGASGYFATDLTGDGSVDVFDYILLNQNIENGISKAQP